MKKPTKENPPFETHNIEQDEDEIIIQDEKPREEGPSETETILANLQNPEDSSFKTPERKMKTLRASGIVLLCLVMLALGYWAGSASLLSVRRTNAPEANINSNEPGSPLLKIAEQTFTGIPVSVVIDNGPNSAPQRGLEKASVIWQALAEGDITRYLAVFTNEIPEIIGPIRSARTYLNTLANQYGGLYLHVGGNDMALEEISKGTFSFTDVNEFSNSTTFYRDSKRKAPHNVFTTRQQIERFIQSKSIPTSTVALLPTSEIPPSRGTSLTSLTIHFAQTNIDTIEWNETAWIKKQNGTIWKDETGKPLSFDSVVLISIQDETGFHKTIPELRRYLFNLGGEAQLLRDGQKFEGSWRLAGNRILFETPSSSPLPFRQGKSLIILVPASVYSKIME